MRGSKTILTIAAIAALAFSGAPLEAQRGAGMRGRDRAQLEERVRARFGQMIRERLDLTEEEGTRLGEVMRSFQAERSTLMRSEQALRRRVEAFTLEGGEDDGEARALLARMAELRAEEARLVLAEQERLLEVLSPGQVLRFISIREDMNSRIRQLRGGPGQGPPGRGNEGRRRPGGLEGAGLPFAWDVPSGT